MKRREFIQGLSGAVAAVWPVMARAQQPAMPVIGFLRNTTAAGASHLVAAFRKGLAEAGLVEGQDISIEYAWADDHLDRMPGLAADLVHRRVACIVANNQSMPAARAATSTIPIVFVAGGDPVQDGLVSNLRRPGGNITGVSFTSSPLDTKRFGLMHEFVPKNAAIGFLLDPSSREPNAQLKAVELAAHQAGRQILVVNAASNTEFATAFSTLVKSNAAELLVGAGAFFLDQRRQLVALAASHNLPARVRTH
jgi:ABC-type uncharacterized transport system substrate-binding protein